MGPRVSAGDVRAAFREAVEEFGEAVTLQQFERWSGYSRSVVYARFESWTELRRLEGLEPNLPGREEVDFKILIDDLVRLRDRLGRIPKSYEIAKLSRFALSTYYNRVGGMKVIRVLLTPHLFRRAVAGRLADPRGAARGDRGAEGTESRGRRRRGQRWEPKTERSPAW